MQCGELTFIGVPKYLLNMASAPVLYVTVLAAKGAQALLAPISRHPRIEGTQLVIRWFWGGGVACLGRVVRRRTPVVLSQCP